MPRKQKPIIVRLRVSTKDIQTNFPSYDPNVSEPEPMDTKSSVQYDEFVPTENRPIRTGTNSEVTQCNAEYKDSKLYPRSSRTVCWWDGHLFDTKPFFIPKTMIQSQSGISYSVYGNFCSPECAMAHLESEMTLDPEVRWERVMLLHEMCKRVYNDTTSRIHPSLPRWVLKEYGGGLDIQEYRKASTQCIESCEIIYPPIIVDIPILKVKNTDKTHAHTEKIIIHEDRFVKAEQNLSKNVEAVPEKRGILDLMNIRVDEVA